MIIHNPILTGSFTVNGVDVLSITGSAANITSLNAATASLNTFSASMLTFTASAATTGSNTFVGNQVVSGSLTVTGSITTPGTLTAQTLVVQTVTSSVIYSSGSNVFGNDIANTQVFTGSMSLTGSLTVVTTGTEFQVNANGVKFGNVIGDAHSITGSVNVSGSAAFSGSVTSNGVLVAGLANGNIRLKGSTDGFLGVGESNGILYLADWATAAKGLQINLSTGAATFSSSVTATSFAAGGASATYPFNSISGAGTQAFLNSTRTGGGGIILQNNSADSVYLGTANWAGVSGFGTSTTDICLAAAANSSAIVFATGTSSTERMRITSGGDVGINCTPSYRFESVASTSNYAAMIRNATAGAGNGLYLYFNNSTSSTNTEAFLRCESAAGVKAYILTNGGLANYQSNNANLSDERTKKDIIPLESYWDKFKAIEIVKFKYKNQSHDDFNIGVIAQQIEEVAPEFVDIDGFGETPKDGIPYKTIYTSDLHHATIKVLQEAMAKIEQLEAEIDELKNK
jgi:hypothetical protein